MFARTSKDNKCIAYLAIPYQDEVTYIEALYPPRRNIDFSSLGRRAPTHCIRIGKAGLFHKDTIQRIVSQPLPSYTFYSVIGKQTLIEKLGAPEHVAILLTAKGAKRASTALPPPIGEDIAVLGESGSNSEPAEELFPDITQNIYSF